MRELDDPPTVALVCPTRWDRTQLLTLRPRSELPYRILAYGEDVERAPQSFDADAFVDRAVESLRAAAIDGVASSSDYPGCVVSAAIAHELGLPGPHPRAVLECAHKFYSRLAQRAAVPEATARFALVDPDNLEATTRKLRFPCFVKPVKATFSQCSKRVDSYDDLARFLRSCRVRRHLTEYVRPFDQLLARYGDVSVGAGNLIAEEILIGRQFTLEGFIHEEAMTVIGIVDSVMHPDSPSFERFDYPSSVSSAVARRMATVAERVMSSIGFSNGLFNIEFVHNEATDDLHIVEINPRMCSQFADLMESVNGTNTYEVLFTLAAGGNPHVVHRPARYGSATSLVFRHFEDARVVSVPDVHQIDALRRRFPVTALALPYSQGQRLSDVAHEYDGHSYRYAILNIAGSDKGSLTRNLRAARDALSFELTD